METSTVALVVSWLSFGVAAMSLGWNIYRDIIIKPKVKVSAGVKDTTELSGSRPQRIIAITATNHGPGTANLQMLHFIE